MSGRSAASPRTSTSCTVVSDRTAGAQPVHRRTPSPQRADRGPDRRVGTSAPSTRSTGPCPQARSTRSGGACSRTPGRSMPASSSDAVAARARPACGRKVSSTERTSVPRTARKPSSVARTTSSRPSSVTPTTGDVRANHPRRPSSRMPPTSTGSAKRRRSEGARSSAAGLQAVAGSPSTTASGRAAGAGLRLLLAVTSTPGTASPGRSLAHGDTVIVPEAVSAAPPGPVTRRTRSSPPSGSRTWLPRQTTSSPGRMHPSVPGRPRSRTTASSEDVRAAGASTTSRTASPSTRTSVSPVSVPPGAPRSVSRIRTSRWLVAPVGTSTSTTPDAGTAAVTAPASVVRRSDRGTPRPPPWRPRSVATSTRTVPSSSRPTPSSRRLRWSSAAATATSAAARSPSCRRRSRQRADHRPRPPVHARPPRLVRRLLAHRRL